MYAFVYKYYKYVCANYKSVGFSAWCLRHEWLVEKAIQSVPFAARLVNEEEKWAVPFDGQTHCNAHSIRFALRTLARARATEREREQERAQASKQLHCRGITS